MPRKGVFAIFLQFFILLYYANTRLSTKKACLGAGASFSIARRALRLYADGSAALSKTESGLRLPGGTAFPLR